MRLLHSALLSVATVPVVAKPFRHPQHHTPGGIAKREPVPAETVVYAPAPIETIIIYELSGYPISEEEVHQGISNGTLMWGEDGNLSTLTKAPAATATATSLLQAAPENTFQPLNLPVYPDNFENHPESEAPIPALPAPSQSPVQPIEPIAPTSNQPTVNDGSCADCDKEFPNGKYSCDKFPTGYGAVLLHNEGLGGWIGIQDPGYSGADGHDDIMTINSGSCGDGSCCAPGRFCSYGCPNPYLKTSWPKLQGKIKQSVGGLYCNEQGKLEMADGSIGKTLCRKGTDKMVVKVHNKLSQSVSICRTDYPGTESETVPLTVNPGETAELANPDQSMYYFWDGKPTSAQYYVNKKGVPESQACTWGSSANAAGNWAPLNFGTSWDDVNMHAGFPSLSQNRPTTEERLDFTVTFVGDGVTDPCQFKHATGEYCQGSECGRDMGCTASVRKGSTLILEFTD